jgi:hypothetical protein
MSTPAYERETNEFVPVTVTVNGAVTISGVSLCVTAAFDERPVTWVAATILDGETGFMLTGRPVGSYRVWAKVSDSPEAPVIDCGTFRVR